MENNSSSLFRKSWRQANFLCNYKLKKLDLDLPPVYKDILTTWSESKQTSPQTSKDIHNKILWNNRFITINGKSIWWKKWFDQGIIRVSDILGPTGRTLTLADIKSKFNVDDWSYISLIDAIPRDWKIILKSETDNPTSRAATLEENVDYTLNIGGRTLKTEKLTNKLIYNSLRNKVSEKNQLQKRNLSNLSEIMT